MPVFRSTWCGRFSSPVSLSSTKELAPSAWCDRRMLRRDGEVFLLGTAMEDLGVEMRTAARPAADVSGGVCLKRHERSSQTRRLRILAAPTKLANSGCG